MECKVASPGAKCKYLKDLAALNDIEAPAALLPTTTKVRGGSCERRGRSEHRTPKADSDPRKRSYSATLTDRMRAGGVSQLDASSQHGLQQHLNATQRSTQQQMEQHALVSDHEAAQANIKEHRLRHELVEAERRQQLQALHEREQLEQQMQVKASQQGRRIDELKLQLLSMQEESQQRQQEVHNTRKQLSEQWQQSVERQEHIRDAAQNMQIAALDVQRCLSVLHKAAREPLPPPPVNLLCQAQLLPAEQASMDSTGASMGDRTDGSVAGGDRCGDGAESNAGRSGHSSRSEGDFSSGIQAAACSGGSGAGAGAGRSVGAAGYSSGGAGILSSSTGDAGYSTGTSAGKIAGGADYSSREPGNFSSGTGDALYSAGAGAGRSAGGAAVYSSGEAGTLSSSTACAGYPSRTGAGRSTGDAGYSDRGGRNSNNRGGVDTDAEGGAGVAGYCSGDGGTLRSATGGVLSGADAGSGMNAGGAVYNSGEGGLLGSSPGYEAYSFNTDMEEGAAYRGSGSSRGRNHNAGARRHHSSDSDRDSFSDSDSGSEPEQTIVAQQGGDQGPAADEAVGEGTPWCSVRGCLLKVNRKATNCRRHRFGASPPVDFTRSHAMRRAKNPKYPCDAEGGCGQMVRCLYKRGPGLCKACSTKLRYHSNKDT
ncbi:hypothetical protein JKP88DRAFT_243862 [Tribonema minus]|uniref:Uncharacterized protein n=1 Tax=Tribonema minus TaxID=303371 RepID=A0A836CIK4_9STRA|nr:hypothetical protein JKP88DRAFT_243862 [Tribonema minus]